MSNSNTNLQTQSLNALYNAIMEAGSKESSTLLHGLITFSGNPEIRGYIDTNPNSGTHPICLSNPPAYSIIWAVNKFQLLKINDYLLQVDACPNACELWNGNTIERLKQGDQSNVQDLETIYYWEFGKFLITGCSYSTTTSKARFVTLGYADVLDCHVRVYGHVSKNVTETETSIWMAFFSRKDVIELDSTLYVLWQDSRGYSDPVDNILTYLR
ncbi:hypothetical protein Tco_0692145 [Tanacetum coccineum]